MSIFLEVDLREGRSTNDGTVFLHLFEVSMCFELTIRRVLGRCQFGLLRVVSTCGWALVLSFALAGAGVLADGSLKLDWDPGVDRLAWESFIPNAGTKSFSASVPPSQLENLSSDEGFASRPIVPATVAVGVIRNTPIADRTKHGDFPIQIREPCVCPMCSYTKLQVSTFLESDLSDTDI